MGVEVMDRSVFLTQWKPQATTGNHSQLAMPLMGEVPKAQPVDPEHIARMSFNGCLSEAVRHSGMDDQQVARRIHITKGYMSKFMNGVAYQWAKRLIAFMRETGSLAPLQWLAHQMGCGLVYRDEITRERDALLARVADLDRRERMAA